MIRILLAAVLALTLALGWSLWRAESHKGRADRAQEAVERTNAALTSERAARANEHKAADRMAEIGDKHEDDRRDAASVPDAVVAALRDGNLRLRNDLATCHTDRLSEATTGSLQYHAPAQLRAEVAAAAIGIGADSDAQLRACQAVVNADRGL